MKLWGFVFVLLLLPFKSVLADCDITNFRWECDIPTCAQSKPPAKSLVVCGNIPVYVTQSQYDLIARYQRADINMVLTINGEYLDSPCVPNGRYGPNYF